MEITLNGEPREVDADTTIADLLAVYGRDDSGVAVAVNLHVVPRQEFGARRLADGDRVDVVTAVGGG